MQKVLFGILLIGLFICGTFGHRYSGWSSLNKTPKTKSLFSNTCDECQLVQLFFFFSY